MNTAVKQEVIHKYEIDITNLLSNGTYEIYMPKNPSILSCQKQKDKLVVWAIVDIDEPKVKKTFKLYGTGHIMDEEKDDNIEVYIGTVQFNDELVLHVFVLEQED